MRLRLRQRRAERRMAAAGTEAERTLAAILGGAHATLDQAAMARGLWFPPGSTFAAKANLLEAAGVDVDALL